MRDIVTVLQKELREILGERASRRGGIVQALVLGSRSSVFFFPRNRRTLWLAGSPYAIIYFVAFPGDARGDHCRGRVRR